MGYYDIDMLITSSSRPQLFPYFWESFKKMIIFRGKLRVIVHEDFVFPEESRKVIEYLEGLKAKGEIDEIHTADPPRGLGMALDYMIGNHIKDKYCLYFQEDWEMERPVDLDELIWIMEDHPQINQVYFNKIRNTGGTTGRQHHFNGVNLCISHHWAFLPGIWRMSKVREMWKATATRPEGHFTNQFGGHEQRMNDDWCEKNMGSYIYGETGAFRYARHLGNNWRMASWRLENGKPGGRHSVDMDVPYMGPWIKYKDRPIRGG